MRVEIEYADHAAGAAVIEAMFGVPRQLLRRGEGWAVETITSLGTHNSTHVDAPWHYNSVVGGEAAQKIDELPLEWFFAPGVRVDFTAKRDGDAVTREQLEGELARVGHELAPLDIVLVHTGRDAFYDSLDYPRLGCGVTADATQWLWEQGVRVMGIDGWSWDGPLHLEAEAQGRARCQQVRCLLGRAPVRSAVLPDRAAPQPRPTSTDRLHRGVLPVADRGRKRSARTRRRNRELSTSATPSAARSTKKPTETVTGSDSSPCFSSDRTTKPAQFQDKRCDSRNEWR